MQGHSERSKVILDSRAEARVYKSVSGGAGGTEFTDGHFHNKHRTYHALAYSRHGTHPQYSSVSRGLHSVMILSRHQSAEKKWRS